MTNRDARVAAIAAQLPPTEARLRAMREAVSAPGLFIWDHTRATNALKEAGLIIWNGRLAGIYEATPAGRAWLKENDKSEKSA